MGNSKNGVSTRLKVLYGILVVLSLSIVLAFYLDKSEFSRQSHLSFFKKETESIANQIDKDDLLKVINNTEFDEIATVDTPEYQRIKAKINANNDIIDFDGTEISILSTGETTTILISSEAIYKNGDIYRDRTEYFTIEHTPEEEAMLISAEINSNLTKLFVILPLTAENGETIAFLQISTPETPYMATMNISLTKYLLIILSIYFIIGIFFTRSLNKNRDSMESELIKSQSIREQLEKSKKDMELLSLVAKSSNNLILITDNRGVILWINDSYQRKNGYSKTELQNFIGKSVSEVSKNDNIENIIKNANSFKKTFEYETRSIDLEHKELWAKTTVYPIVENNNITKIIMVDSDITELIKLQEQLEVRKLSPDLRVSSY